MNTGYEAYKKDKYGNLLVWTLCQHCKKPFQVRRSSLKYGGGKYCGTKCCRRAVSAERLIRPQIKDLTGRKFGRWTVLRYDSKRNGKSYWKCECECGNTGDVSGQNLKKGMSKSCGCLKQEVHMERATTHGMTKTRIYRVWGGMKSRCQIESASAFYKYGERGISVCDEWQDFEPFMRWALANGYEEHLEVDRMDNYGDYCPENCRIVTKKENMQNRRTAQDKRRAAQA